MSEARPLTARQAEILAFCIRWLLDHHTTAPIRAICARFGFRSTNGANDHIRALEAKGFMRRHHDGNGLFILRHPDGRPFEIAVK
jgi:SOS-response transcriptional repressor LexA